MSIFTVPHEKSRFNTKGRQQRHSTRKPPKVFEYLIRTYSKPNDLIFDGYMGSGSSAEAAWNTGRNYIGCEIDKKIFERAEKEVNTHISQTLMPFEV